LPASIDWRQENETLPLFFLIGDPTWGRVLHADCGIGGLEGWDAAGAGWHGAKPITRRGATARHLLAQELVYHIHNINNNSIGHRRGGTLI